MIRWTLLHKSRLVATTLSLLAVLGGVTSCSDPLAVSDPTAFQEQELNNVAGAELLRRGALQALSFASDDAAWNSGLLADEFLYDVPFIFAPGTQHEEMLDRRESVLYEQLSQFSFAYRNLQGLRARETPIALAKLRSYAPPGAREAHIGEMLAVRGFAMMRVAEDFCPGFPLNEVVDYKVVYGSPVSTEQAFQHALVDFDSAVTWAADSARVLDFARIGRARTLLNLGRFADAAAAVNGVLTSYVYQAEYSTQVVNGNNTLSSNHFWWGFFRARSIADREGGTGLDFVSADDPRVGTTPLGTARDGVTRVYGIAKYPTQAASIVLANGIEARLIESEAYLQANDSRWLSTLNELRATQVNPALGALADPGTPAGRVDLLFRERAFWLFATGHRLGDLRRLIRQYGRTSESVFPTGNYRTGGTYGSATNVPFYVPDEALNNPAVTGCTSR